MAQPNHIQLVECPRDAMQGWHHFIPTQQKIDYLKSLLKVGFHTLDCGSFVSAKAIPQMADTKEVLQEIAGLISDTELLTIVLNKRGAEATLEFPEIRYLGFPFSVSETFQMRNGNSTIEENFIRLKEIHEIATDNGKEVVVYLSMAFGNPYGDTYNEVIVRTWAERIAALGIKIISLADTIGLATAEQVQGLCTIMKEEVSNIELGVHLHSDEKSLIPKLHAALTAGISRYDGALLGIGGCPMSGNDLVGNMKMEKMIGYFQQENQPIHINNDALQASITMAKEIFV